MAYLPLKNPPPTDSVAIQVMEALDIAMPIVPEPQNFNGPYPQTIDIDSAYRYEGVTQEVLSDQYIRAAKFYGGGTPDENSAARTACYVQNHSNSELIARWCKINGSKPVTREYLGITTATPGEPIPVVPTPIEEAQAALAAVNAAIVALNSAVAKL